MEDFSNLVSFETCVMLYKENLQLYGSGRRVSDIGLLHNINILLSDTPLFGIYSFPSILFNLDELSKYPKTIGFIRSQFGLDGNEVYLWIIQLTRLRNQMIKVLVCTHGKLFGAIYLSDITMFCEELMRDPREILRRNGQKQSILDFLELFRESRNLFYNGLLSYIFTRFNVPTIMQSLDRPIIMKFIKKSLNKE